MILITGGAGYIGSVTVELLRRSGTGVVVLDNLCHGHREALHPDVPFYQGNVEDRELVQQIVRKHGVEACIHFAAFINVGESVEKPYRYYHNNVASGMELLHALTDAGIRRFVFSSTCATYGEPQRMPMEETHPQWPQNPYGWSKLFMERILHDFDRAHGFRFMALRYFNASGAFAHCGEAHDPETHLIPNVLKVALGQRADLKVFGDDYPTPDGSAVRDYIHVADLGQAHILALDYLRAGGESQGLNLGTGTGYSVLQLVEAARRITGHAIPTEVLPRRAGDASQLVADSSRAHQILGWEPQLSALDEILESAWKWHSAHPNGYAATI